MSPRKGDNAKVTSGRPRKERPPLVSLRQELVRQYRAFRQMVDRGGAAHQILRVALKVSNTASEYPRVRAWVWIYMGRVYARQRDESGAVLCAQRAWRIAERNHVNSLKQAFMRRGRGMCGLARSGQHPNLQGEGSES